MIILYYLFQISRINSGKFQHSNPSAVHDITNISFLQIAGTEITSKSVISQIYRFFKLPEHKTQVSHNGFGFNRGNVEGHLSLNVYIEYRVYQYWGVFCLFVFFGFFKIFFFSDFFQNISHTMLKRERERRERGREREREKGGRYLKNQVRDVTKHILQQAEHGNVFHFSPRMRIVVTSFIHRIYIYQI